MGKRKSPPFALPPPITPNLVLSALAGRQSLVCGAAVAYQVTGRAMSVRREAAPDKKLWGFRMPGNHDALFRSAFSHAEHASGIVRAALPAPLAAKIDWTTMKLAPGEFVDEHLTERKTDLLFEVQLAGTKAFLHILFEHQSTPANMMAARLFTYVGRIWDRWRAKYPSAKRLPAILPIVLYHGEQPWVVPTKLSAIIDGGDDAAALTPYTPELRYFLDDLGNQDEAALRARAASTAFARLVLLVLQSRFRGRDITDDLARWADLVREAYRAPHGGQALALVLRYILEEADASADVIESFVVDELGDQGREVYMTAAQRIREEARVQGKAEVVARLLRLRFGELPESARLQLQGANADQLDAWADRIISAPTLQAVFD